VQGSAQSLPIAGLPSPSGSGRSTPSSRQEAHRSALPRPLRATRGATRALPADPHKAVVDALWDRLPDAVKAAVAAMVRAAVK
jgi:hypothetical protein